jgi:hypothetical protein
MLQEGCPLHAARRGLGLFRRSRDASVAGAVDDVLALVFLHKSREIARWRAKSPENRRSMTETP